MWQWVIVAVAVLVGLLVLLVLYSLLVMAAIAAQAEEAAERMEATIIPPNPPLKKGGEKDHRLEACATEQT